MSLSRSEKVQLGKIKQKRLSIDLEVDTHLVNERGDELVKGQRNYRLTLATRKRDIFITLDYVPRESDNYHINLKTLFQHNPWATLHTPKFSILFNV